MRASSASSEDFVQTNRVFPVGGRNATTACYLTAKSPRYELGGDISRPLAGGVVKFVALANRRHRETLDTSLERIDGVVVGGFEQGTEFAAQRDDRRASTGPAPTSPASRSKPAAKSPSTRSIITLDLFELERRWRRAPGIDLPIDDATVREKRGEIYVKAGRQLVEALRLDAGLNVETSRLKVRGDTIADRSLELPQAQPDARL